MRASLIYCGRDGDGARGVWAPDRDVLAAWLCPEGDRQHPRAEAPLHCCDVKKGAG